MVSAPRHSFPIKSQPHFGGLTPSVLFKWAPVLAVWGIGAAGAGALFLSPIPLFQKDVLHKIPFVSAYFKDATPESDKPF